jgi:hypothetical protein
MRLISWVVGPMVALSLAAASVQAADCPAKSTAMDDIVEALNGSPDCDRAMRVFEACEFGASGDVRLGAIVETKCEGDFLARLKAPQIQVYRREMRVCDRKYRNQSGTMALSFTAFCRATVAQHYSQGARKVAGSSPAR